MKTKYSSIKLVILSAAFLFGTGCPTLIPGASVEEQTTEANRVISADPRFKAVDDVCSKVVPRSEHFFVGKSRLFNTVGITHLYRVNGDLSQTEMQMAGSLKDDGWLIHEVDRYYRIHVFRKKEIQIELQFEGISAEANLATTCSIVRASTTGDDK